MKLNKKNIKKDTTKEYNILMEAYIPIYSYYYMLGKLEQLLHIDTLPHIRTDVYGAIYEKI